MCSALLLVADPNATFVTAECTDYASHSRWVASLALEGAVQCVGVEGKIGCVGEVLFEAGPLLTVDLRDLSAPVVLGELESWRFGGGMPVAVVVAGGFAYLLTDTMGSAALVVVDLADPANPVVAGRLRLPGSAEHDLALAGGYVYVCDRHRGFLIAVDVTDPRAPRLAGEVPVSGGARAIAVAGGFAYVADATSSIHVFGLAVPDTPAEIAKLARPTPVYDLDAAPGGLLYVVRDRTFEVIDVSRPGHPVPRGSLATSTHVYNVTADGARALVSDYQRGLLAIDVSDPSSPALAAELGPPDGWDIVVARGHALVASGWSGLQVYDLAGLTSPPRLGHVATLGPALGVILEAHANEGELAYVAATSHLEIVALSDLSRPERLSALETPGDAMDVTVVGKRAYVADGNAGLTVIDVADPRAPQIVVTVDTPGFANAVAVSDGHAYIADYYEGLQIFDVSKPGSPVRVGGFDPGGFEAEVLDVAVSDSYAYLAASRSGVLVLGVWVASQPQLIAGRLTPGWATGVELADDRLIVSDHRSGVTALDVRVPQAPVLLATVDTPGDAQAAAVRDDVVYVAGGGGGLGVLEAEPSGAFSLIGAGFLPGDVQDVAVPGAERTPGAEDHFVVVARGLDGLDVIPAQCDLGFAPVALASEGAAGSPPRAASLTSASPNPAAGDVTLTLLAPGSMPIEIGLYDAAGRCVRHLAVRAPVAGTHRVNWNGRADDGSPVASGVYLARVMGVGAGPSVRVVVVR